MSTKSKHKRPTTLQSDKSYCVLDIIMASKFALDCLFPFLRNCNDKTLCWCFYLSPNFAINNLQYSESSILITILEGDRHRFNCLSKKMATRVQTAVLPSMMLSQSTSGKDISHNTGMSLIASTDS